MSTPFAPKVGADGLFAVVAMDEATGELLMLAHANERALRLTLETGEAHYWSRSRGELWHKGATSGAIQHVSSIVADCDLDAYIYRVRIDGPDCHTGRRSCFYREVKLEDGALTLSPA